jgi:hypothetical protein
VDDRSDVVYATFLIVSCPIGRDKLGLSKQEIEDGGLALEVMFRS